MKKATARILAALIAAALVLTSGIAVFAADSPVKGQIANGSAAVTSSTTIDAVWGAKDGATSYDVYVNGTKVGNTTSTNYRFTVAQNGNYIISVAPVKGTAVGEQTVLGYASTCAKASKVKAKRAGSKKIKVTWKKNKGVSYYSIAVYKNGTYWKTVTAGKKATSKTFKKLKKGAKYKFVVTPVYSEAYVGMSGYSKKVKAK